MATRDRQRPEGFDNGQRASTTARGLRQRPEGFDDSSATVRGVRWGSTMARGVRDDGSEGLATAREVRNIGEGCGDSSRVMGLFFNILFNLYVDTTKEMPLFLGKSKFSTK